MCRWIIWYHTVLHVCVSRTPSLLCTHVCCTLYTSVQSAGPYRLQPGSIFPPSRHIWLNTILSATPARRMYNNSCHLFVFSCLWGQTPLVRNGHTQHIVWMRICNVIVDSCYNIALTDIHIGQVRAQKTYLLFKHCLTNRMPNAHVERIFVCKWLLSWSYMVVQRSGKRHGTIV